MDFRRFSGQDEGRGESHTVQIIVFLTAILSGSATLASQYTQLPWWHRYPLALFTLVSLIVLLNTFLWPPVRSAVASKREQWRLDATFKGGYSPCGGNVPPL